MKSALMWTINDFLAYGMLLGWMTLGRHACPICMEITKAFSLNHSHKISYFDCHRQFLSLNYPFRKDKKAFKKKFVKNSPIFCVCPVLIFGIGLQNYHYALNYKKRIFLNMV